MHTMERLILYPLFLAALVAVGVLLWYSFASAASLQSWQAANARAVALLQNAQTEGSNLQIELNAAQSAVNSLQTDQGRLRAELAELQAAQESAARQIELYRNGLREANANVQRSNANIVELAQQLDTTRSERNAALTSLDTERENLAAEKQLNQRQSTAIAALESDLRDKDRRISQQTAQINQQNTRINDQSRLINQQNDQITQQTTTISNLRASLNQAKSQQVSIPSCSSNYFTLTSGQLSCVARSTAAFQATQVETRSINLPQTGPVTLKINRSGELGSAQSMEILEHAVRTIEEYMGQPIPLQGREIRLDFVKSITGGGDFAGIYKGTHIEILQQYDDGKPWRRDILGSIIAHEVAHYYWNGERVWVDEGAADFLALYSEHRRTNAPISVQSRPCYYVSNISQLESQRYDHGDAGFQCNYSLGERLFVDLYDSLPETQFRQSFRDLYASGKNKLAGVHQLRAAYPNSGAIIDRWYGYREMPELHQPNGDFLGYMTWQEGDDWHLPVNSSGRPCATILRLNETSAGGYSVRATRPFCYYPGDWSAEGDLLVTVNGVTYRAVDIKISRRPRYGSSVSVHPGRPLPSPTVIPLRGQL